METVKNVKLVVVGDGNVGKTSMLISYTENWCPVEHVPTLFENLSTGVTIDGTFCNVALWDTAGQEGYERLRALSYPDTDIFLLCFAVDCPESLTNIVQRWNVEVNHHCPKAGKILVGTKIDLRETASVSTTLAEGEQTAKQVGAKMYLECSSLTRDGLKRVFEEAIRSTFGTDVLPHQTPRKPKTVRRIRVKICTLL